jgi:hypothetical protein
MTVGDNRPALAWGQPLMEQATRTKHRHRRWSWRATAVILMR